MLPLQGTDELTPIYIAGPMSGYDDFNYPAFYAVEDDLKRHGYKLINNPARHFNGEQHHPWTDYIEVALQAVLHSRALVVMQGWQHSVGATLEVLVALSIDHPIFTAGLNFENAYEYRAWDVDDRRAMIGALIGMSKRANTDDREVESDVPPHIEADNLVNGARQANYGHPLDNFTGTAGIWNGIVHKKLKEPLTAEDVALCMVGVKLSRETHVPKRDNLVDAHGYLMTYQMVKDERVRRAEEN